MKTIKLGIIGLGTVGSGVVRIIQKNQQKFRETSGCCLQIKTIVVADRTKKRKVDLQGIKITDQINDLLDDNEIQIVIEVMGTIQPAQTYIEALLKSGKNVITANKDLLATNGSQLIECAQQNHVNLSYEASVAGDIPILRTISNSFTADQIIEVSGIVNGTSNYILTQMAENHSTYQEALQNAQALGLAEHDPTNDVNGKDSAYKMAILAEFAFGTTVPLEKIAISGIEQVTKNDILQAQKYGYAIKLVGQAKILEDNLSVSVQPMFVKKGHPLANIKDENNAVLVTGSAVGKILFYGAGAGELPTANSILSDVIATIKDIQLNITGSKFNNFSRTTNIIDASKEDHKYFLSFNSDGNILPSTKIRQNLRKSGINLAAAVAVDNSAAGANYQTQLLSKSQFNFLKQKGRHSDKLHLDLIYPILD